eukprot:332934-Chlamydomonas_euryale.AAC.1
MRGKGVGKFFLHGLSWEVARARLAARWWWWRGAPTVLYPSCGRDGQGCSASGRGWRLEGGFKDDVGSASTSSSVALHHSACSAIQPCRSLRVTGHPAQPVVRPNRSFTLVSDSALSDFPVALMPLSPTKQPLPGTLAAGQEPCQYQNAYLTGALQPPYQTLT